MRRSKSSKPRPPVGEPAPAAPLADEPTLPEVHDRAFPAWMNETFAHLQLARPEAVDRCRAPSGKVRPRGPWDRDPAMFDLSGAEEFQFMQHQELVRAFLAQEDPKHPLRFRGLYLVHGLGSGKSCSAIAAAEALMHRRNVVVMTPASLRANFLSELRKCGSAGFRSGTQDVASRFSFVSYDAPNTLEQLARVPDGLDHKLLIVDEVHNLLNMICTGSKKGLGLYAAMMEATNLRLLFMSGTPLINDPFEIAIAANLLRGYLTKGLRPIERPRFSENRFEMFPSVRDFDMRYLNDKDPDAFRLKNTAALRMRLAGIFSYYAGVQPQDLLMPQLVEHPTIYVPMSEHQCRLYEEARKPERELEKRAAKEAREKGKAAPRGFELGQRSGSGSKLGGSVSLHRAFSRQICNFAFPEAIPRPITKGKSLDIRKDRSGEGLLAIGLVGDADLLTAPEDTVRMDKQDELRQQQALQRLAQNAEEYLQRDLAVYSPKMKRVVELLEVSPGPAYVYSQFRTMEGIGILALILQAHGYIQYGWGDPEVKAPPMRPLPHTRDARTGKRWDECSAAERRAFLPRAYLVWPRSSQGAEREHLLRTFNDHANRDGSRIRVFLSTKAGAEGISLMNVRQVHLLEPYWNEALMRQAIGRARRICSHAALPLEDRVVDVYRYVSVFPPGYRSKDKDGKGRPQTSDQYVENIAALKRSITADMMQVLREAAVDCSLNLAHNRLGEGGEAIRCLTYPGKTDGPAYRLGLDYDAVAMAGLAEHRHRPEQLVAIQFPHGRFRIRAEDLARVRSPKEDDHGTVELFHAVDPRVVARVRLERGRMRAWLGEDSAETP